MKHILALTVLIFTCAFGLSANALMMAPPAEPKSGIEIVDVYAFATPQANPAAAVFMTVHNHGIAGDKMVGFTLAENMRTELHTMTMENEIMRMRKVDGYDLGANKTVSLIPMGHHVMVFDRVTDWNVGDVVNGTVIFENAGNVPVEIHIKSRGEKTSHDHGDHSMDHNHHGHH
jgi:copper(I)-binding protein